jgi:hypothetical protein
VCLREHTQTRICVYVPCDVGGLKIFCVADGCSIGADDATGISLVSCKKLPQYSLLIPKGGTNLHIGFCCFGTKFC